MAAWIHTTIIINYKTRGGRVDSVTQGGAVAQEILQMEF